MTACKLIGSQAAIQNDGYIRHAFLLEFIGIELVNVAGAGTPVDGTGRISRLVFAHPEELGSGAPSPGRDRPCVDACAARADRNLTDARHRREYEQAPLGFHMDI